MDCPLEDLGNPFLNPPLVVARKEVQRMHLRDFLR